MSSDSNTHADLADMGSGNTDTFCTKHSTIYPALSPSSTSFSSTKTNNDFVVCIVGASRGIGAGIAYSYAKAKAPTLILSSRRLSGLEETASKCRELNPNGRVEIIPCDITSEPSVAALASHIKTTYGRLDILIINSGTSGPIITQLHQNDPKTFEQVTAVNYLGTFYCAHHFIPLLLSSPHGAKSLIATSSIAALIVRGVIANPQYTVSKAAQLRLLECAHEQYKDQGLGVYAVHPGAVLTEIAEETAPEEFKPYLTDSPELCGAFCVWLTREDKREERRWLAGRLLSACWDVEELEGKKEEIVNKDLLKLKLTM